MKASRRWLVIFGSIFWPSWSSLWSSVALINSGQEEALLPADTPQGTVQRFLLLAYRDHDYQQAASYLDLPASTVPDKLSPVDAWSQATLNPPPSNGWKATLLRTDIFDDHASVAVEISFFPSGGVLDRAATNEVNFELTKENGVWRITGLPYFWWALVVPQELTL